MPPNDLVMPFDEMTRDPAFVDFIQDRSADERFDAVISFLYLRRNMYTHDSTYPQLGFHPNLSVMHRKRLNVPGTGSVGDFDRLQVLEDPKGNLYFTYYETNDVVGTLRACIVRGLLQAVGSA